MPTLVCNCNDTMPLDAEVLSKTLGEPLRMHSLLCRREMGDYLQAIEGTDDVVVACTQEQSLFAAVAEQQRAHGAPVLAPIRFVNIRETGGWSQSAQQQPQALGAKVAAILAVAALPEPEPVAVVDYTSQGRVLITGPADRALPWAARLHGALQVTVLDTGARVRAVDDSQASARAFVVASGQLTTLQGWLGAFTATWQAGNPIDLDVCTRCNACIAACPEGAIDFSYQVDLDACRAHRACVKACGVAGAIDFARTPSEVSESFDLVFDLNDAPAFSMHQPPQGYLHAGGDVTRQEALALQLTQMVGNFEKPRFFEYRDSLCAHGRNDITGCSACIEVCSTQAISAIWKDGKGSVQVNPNLCMGCGACGTVCPTGAMRYNYPEAPYTGRQLKTLLGTYRQARGRDATVLLHDRDGGQRLIDQLGRRAMVGRAAGVPVNVLPLAVFHPASTGLDLWLTAFAYGAQRVSILLTDEIAPEYRAALTTQMAVAQQIVNGLGYAGTHFTLIEAANPASLDDALRRSEPASACLVPATFNPSQLKRETFDFALDHLWRHAPQPTEAITLPSGAPFGTLTVDQQRCTLCMSCVGACPAQALRDNAERPVLGFIERNCVQCGLCASTCPEDAISLAPRLIPGEHARRQITLNEAQPFHCVRCAKPFGTQQMINVMLSRLAGHSAFSGKAAERLKMCPDCRVVDMVERSDDPSILH
jgi:ferredoxin